MSQHPYSKGVGAGEGVGYLGWDYRGGVSF